MHFRVFVCVWRKTVLYVLEIFMECADAITVWSCVSVTNVVFLGNCQMLISGFTCLEFEEMLSITLFSWNKQETFTVFAETISQAWILAREVWSNNSRFANENENQVWNPRQFLVKFLTSNRIILRAVNLLTLTPVETRNILGKKFDQIASKREIRILDWEFDFDFFLEIV